MNNKQKFILFIVWTVFIMIMAVADIIVNRSNTLNVILTAGILIIILKFFIIGDD